MDQNVAASLAASLGPPELEHVVFFTSAMGSEEAERFPSLVAAVRRVEMLCNDEDVRDAAVFLLTPVPLMKKQRWHVEAGDLPAAPAAAATAPVSALSAVRTWPAEQTPPPPPVDPPVADAMAAPPPGQGSDQPAARPVLTAVAAPQTFVPTEEDVPTSEPEAAAAPAPPAPAPRRGLGLFAH